MVPVLTQTLGTSSTASLHPPSTPLRSSSARALGFRPSFLSRPLLSRSSFPAAGLRCKVQRRERRMGPRCEAAVTEKEADEASGEKFEYQAEVGLRFFWFSFPSDLLFIFIFSHASFDFSACRAGKLESYLVCLTQERFLLPEYSSSDGFSDDGFCAHLVLARMSVFQFLRFSLFRWTILFFVLGLYYRKRFSTTVWLSG